MKPVRFAHAPPKTAFFLVFLLFRTCVPFPPSL
jgi:hypothetical protein